jgi:acyl-CoA synthetase (AMP-forming)/AMP-acid ligase II
VVAAPASYNFADVWEMSADAHGDREALVVGEERRTYAQLEDNANRLANHLLDRGVGPGDHVGLYLENCPEYLEAMIACFKIRAVPININHRYVAGELEHLLRDSDSVGVLHGPQHRDVIDAVLPNVPTVRWSLVTGAAYDAALAAASPERPARGGRGDDDHYVMYTGGTTGMPKGVVWRQGDAFFTCFGGGDPMRLQGEVSSPAELLDRMGVDLTYLPLAPLMHAAAQWTSFMWFFCGARVVLMSGSLDPERVWRTVQDEGVQSMTVVGDAVAKPLLDAWDAMAEGDRPDLSGLYAISNGGAPMSAGCKARILSTFPHVMVNDGFGSSEAGVQGTSRVTASDGPASGPVRFATGAKPIRVLDDDDRPVEPGSGAVGRIVTGGRLPLGYHGDPEKTAATFLTFEGERWLITGDLATVAEDGTVELLGRGSVSINTGGEKVHPEEVEGVLHGHPSVADVLVVGVPDERWGSAVTAVVQPAPGTAPTLDELVAHCKQHLSGYKAPKHLVLVDEVVRSPAGKADYRWAADTAAKAVADT